MLVGPVGAERIVRSDGRRVVVVEDA